MERLGSLVTVGTAHVLLLLSCLAFNVHSPAWATTQEALFDPSDYTWQDSNFKPPPMTKSIIVRFNEAEKRFQTLYWPSSSIRLRKGQSFSGYLYFRGKMRRNFALKVFPDIWLNAYDDMVNHNKRSYCIAIDIHQSMRNNIPGSGDLMQQCLQCNSLSCPQLPGPCSCGWLVHNEDPAKNHEQPPPRFVGVRWLDDEKLNDPK